MVIFPVLYVCKLRLESPGVLFVNVKLGSKPANEGSGAESAVTFPETDAVPPSLSVRVVRGRERLFVELAWKLVERVWPVSVKNCCRLASRLVVPVESKITSAHTGDSVPAAIAVQMAR
jgi:hypothetical protein